MNSLIEKNKKKIRVCIFFTMLLFYSWICTHTTFDFKINDFNPCGYISYHELTDALIDSMVSLHRKPDPRLIALDDPYDPSANASYRWHDASYYKGKYYLYFGISPEVLYLPYKLIVKKYLPDSIVILFFVFGVFCWAALILIYFKNKYFFMIPEWMLVVSLLVLGCANLSPFILISATDCGVAVYDAAISCGAFFLIGGLYFFCRAFGSNYLNIKLLCAGSLFFGFAIGARPIWIISTPLLLLLILKEVVKKINLKNCTLKKTQIFSLFIPYAICIILLGLYNFYRFENPFEFGFKYELAYHNKYRFFDLNSLIPGIYFYILNPPIILKQFPFFFLNLSVGNNLFMKLPMYYVMEDMASLISIPFLLIPFIFILCIKCRDRKHKFKLEIFKKHEYLLLLIPASVNLVFFILHSSVSTRYSFTHSTLFILLTSILWFYLEANYKIPYKKYFVSLVLVLSLVSIYIGFSFIVDGYRYTIKNTDMQTFHKLQENFQCLESIIPIFMKIREKYLLIIQFLLSLLLNKNQINN